MKYLLARKIDIYNFASGEHSTVIARPSAWHEASLWGANHKHEAPEEVAGVESTYTWVYFALKQNGMLEKHGLSDKFDRNVLMDMMDTMAVYMDELEDSDIPLAM